MVVARSGMVSYRLRLFQRSVVPQVAGDPRHRGSESGPLRLPSMPAAFRYSSRYCSRVWWRRHPVLLAAFLMEPQPGAFSLRIIILERHGDHGADAGEGIDHGGDDRPVAQTGQVRQADLVSLRIEADDAGRGDGGWKNRHSSRPESFEEFVAFHAIDTDH